MQRHIDKKDKHRAPGLPMLIYDERHYCFMTLLSTLAFSAFVRNTTM